MIYEKESSTNCRHTVPLLVFWQVLVRRSK